jgi:hypothetical protein
MSLFLEKFTTAVALLKDARSINARLLMLGDPRTHHQAMLLQRILERVQALAVSMQADFIEMFFSDKPAKAEDLGPSAVPVFGRPIIKDRYGAPFFDRRHQLADRRQLRTYLANDPRSGIADRRRKKLERNAPS